MNITQVYKAISFTNKKTENEPIDNFVMVEGGDIYLMDLTKMYKICGEGIQNNFVIKKEELSQIKTKNAKYFLQLAEKNMISVGIETKTKGETNPTTVVKDIPVLPRTCGIKKLVDSVEFKNSINVDGMFLKTYLKSMDKEVRFNSMDENLYFGFDDNELPLSEFCACEVLETSGSSFRIIGQSVSDCISQLGVTKKNNMVNIKFNEDWICVSGENIHIYLAGNK